MKDLFKTISEFKGNKKGMFLETVFGNEDYSGSFLHILKQAEETHKNTFFKGMAKEDIKWFEDSIKESEDVDEVKLNEDITKIKEIANNLDKHQKEANQKKNEEAIELRKHLKAGFENCGISDQSMGKKSVPMEKEYDKNGTMIELPEPNKKVILKENIFDCIGDRESRRKYTDAKLSIDELSYLLWATQGVRKAFPEKNVSLRTVPSGGARQPFETYLAIDKVESIPKGVYRYLPLEHKLYFLFSDENMVDKVNTAAYGQSFVGNCAVCFIWSTIPYRCEWRYTTEAKKIIAQDSGHLCQNLYLAAESINCGTCGIGAYDQKLMDEFLSLDGIDEFVVYAAPVGKVEIKKEEPKVPREA
ncbi:MAG: SagB/ThcOx family dehydrogenase [Candidatus Delongbacteria bacterium]|jgi:SagB-type dehydrogenase family enzyme|nr:SagB/ThcOx family dehydrogenase [Candidatus Delongbacteria bacterium]